jgi:hypothetical protein
MAVWMVDDSDERSRKPDHSIEHGLQDFRSRLSCKHHHKYLVRHQGRSIAGMFKLCMRYPGECLFRYHQAS